MVTIGRGDCGWDLERRVFSQVWVTGGEGPDVSEKSRVGQKAALDPLSS